MFTSKDPSPRLAGSSERECETTSAEKRETQWRMQWFEAKEGWDAAQGKWDSQKQVENQMGVENQSCRTLGTGRYQ